MNEYEAQADDIRARLATITNPKLRRELLAKLDFYKQQAAKFEAAKGTTDAK